MAAVLRMGCRSRQGWKQGVDLFRGDCNKIKVRKDRGSVGGSMLTGSKQCQGLYVVRN